ncbi:rho GTPase-activating protein 7-like [Melozone crissalis]|uniref:rho GTPase-activating protein 7-like n=1 Tax=Melozone crissalis TaxID=40204 RepID=UPI0023DA4F78|nr:rho GTPase-activating protein 7-like [Melozone crissalis]
MNYRKCKEVESVAEVDNHANMISAPRFIAQLHCDSSSLAINTLDHALPVAAAFADILDACGKFQEPTGEENDKDLSKGFTISLGVLVISLGADAKELDKDAIKVATKFWDTLQFPAVITEELAAVPKHQHDSKQYPSRTLTHKISESVPGEISFSLPLLSTVHEPLCVLPAEIEAREACDWLRAAGFPQYAQLFEDMQFPIDVKTVRRDHEFLDGDAIESLFRRLNTLNKYASMKVEISRDRNRSDGSEDDEPCAISDRWAYERCSQRWSRVGSLAALPAEQGAAAPTPVLKIISNEDSVCLDHGEKHDVSSVHSTSSADSDVVNSQKPFEDVETSTSSSRCSSVQVPSLDSAFSCSPPPSEFLNISSEEKLLDKSPSKKRKSLLKKMEKLHLRSCNLRSGQSKAKPIISEPVLLEGLNEEKMKMLNCVNISDLSGIRTKNNSPFSPQSSNSSNQSVNSSTGSTARPGTKPGSPCEGRRMHAEHMDTSKLLLGNDLSQQNLKNDVTLPKSQMFQIPQGHKPGTFPTVLTDSSLSADSSSVNWRTGSFHGCRRSRSGSRGARSPVLGRDQRLSVYDNMPSPELQGLEQLGDDDVFSELNSVIADVNGLKKLVDQWTEKFSDDGDSDFASDLASLCPPSPKESSVEAEGSEDKAAGEAGGESSCGLGKEIGSAELAYTTDSKNTNRHGKQHWCVEENLEGLSLQTDGQSAAQLARTQKLALLKLTALMDRYSPSSKQGWNWTIPKFIKKPKASDYKDKNVFGVPLLLNMQRTSHPLPNGILQALEYLRSHFLDQVGLFRKSGVKSRILSLREMNETSPNNVCYEGQSAFDVADMVKQYFRDLPEPIFTSRLCESFLHIYQYVPKDEQFQAVQAAILLLPKENREALKILLFFLRDVVAFVEENQMTPTNIAVCLAPSLFHLNTLRRDSSSSSTRSSQRKCSLGKPDQRELNENLAATQGLAHMIMECNRLFQTDFPA